MPFNRSAAGCRFYFKQGGHNEKGVERIGQYVDRFHDRPFNGSDLVSDSRLFLFVLIVCEVMKMKILCKPVGAFGGSAFRAIERGDRVVVQESVQGARWRDLAVTSVSEFYKYADRFDLFNVYENDPAKLWKIAGAIARANDLISECN